MAKGDVKIRRVALIENKTTVANQRQIVMKADVLEKLVREAWAEGLMPFLQFDLGGKPYVISTEADHLDLMEAAGYGHGD